MPYKPCIGITMRLDAASRRYYLGRDYCEALAAHGAVPLHIPLIADETYLAEAAAKLDGLLLPGSDSDIDPAYFTEDPHPKLGSVVPEKDETDQLMLKIAEEWRIPVFGICYGMQALNVSRGGSLVQDIEAQVGGAIQHQQSGDRSHSSHYIELTLDSILSKTAAQLKLTKVKVNSHHHQAIKNTGKNLRAVAAAPDGIIEAVTDTRSDRFVLGVQWHPELNWATDQLSWQLFKTFVDAATNFGDDLRQKSLPLPTIVPECE